MDFYKLSKLAFIIMLLSIISKTSFADEFCSGFEQGYKTGYMQANQSSFEPFTPFCPFEPLKKFSDPQSDYEFGYTIGYKQGMAS